MTEEQAESEPDVFSLVLQFRAAECPDCGRPGEPGTCVDCGAQVPAVAEVSEAAQARQKAAAPLARSAGELVVKFDSLPSGNIPLSNDQFTTALVDADVFGLIQQMPTLGRDVEKLDLNDPTVVGQDLRRILVKRLRLVEDLLNRCHELAYFRPQGPAADLRVVSVEAGRYGAELIAAYLQLLVQPSIAEARVAEAELQRLLNDIPFSDRVHEALNEVPNWRQPDVDSRVGLVIDRAGVYTDDFGFLDISRIFSAFAGEGEPFEILAQKAREYFTHLLGPRTAETSSADALLILPAVALATLDRPLTAHRLARTLTTLLEEAAEQNTQAVSTLVDRTTAQGPLLFAAAAQIERGFKMLAAGEWAGLVDEHDLAQTLMSTYLSLAESSLRTYGWLARDLARVVAGKPIESGTQPPTLGALVQELEALESDLGSTLVAATDTGLRNAAAHQQYRWNSGLEQLEDLRTGQVWSLERFERSSLSLSGAAIGLEAGYACFFASGTLPIEAPEWLTSGEVPRATEILAQVSFGAFGIRVLEVRDDGATLVVEASNETDKLRLMPALVGLSTTLSGPELFRVFGDDEALLLSVSESALAEARNADEATRDLAALAPFLDDAARSGIDSREALMRVLAVQVAQVVITAIDSVQSPDAGPQTARRIGERLNFVIDFAKSKDESRDREIGALVKRLGRASSGAFATSQGFPGATDRLESQLTALVKWADAQGVSWPPF